MGVDLLGVDSVNFVRVDLVGGHRGNEHCMHWSDWHSLLLFLCDDLQSKEELCISRMVSQAHPVRYYSYYFLFVCYSRLYI